MREVAALVDVVMQSLAHEVWLARREREWRAWARVMMGRMGVVGMAVGEVEDGRAAGGDGGVGVGVVVVGG